MERGLKFNLVVSELSDRLEKLPYDNGDLSDIGNEVGYILGGIIKDMNDEDVQTFIMGFKHGVSLTNGTHFTQP